MTSLQWRHAPSMPQQFMNFHLGFIAHLCDAGALSGCGGRNVETAERSPR